MGIAAAVKRFIENRWHPLQAQIATAWLLSGAVSDTGRNITPDQAMQAAAVFACVSVISSSLATIPIRIRRRDTRVEITDHPLCRILNAEPNTEMTSASFRESFIANTLLWGNGYAWIERDGMDVAALWPLRAGSTTPFRTAGGPLLYSAVTGAASYTWTPDRLLHLPDISYDGVVGLSRTRYAANPIGLSLAMETFGAKFFANGGNLGGLLMLPPGMKKDAVKAYVASWKQNYAGADNAFKTALLTDGIKYEKVATDPRNAQMIDTRAFQVKEIARIYRVPLHKLGDLDGATFSNIEQQDIEFVQDCLMPWGTKDVQELSRKLLRDDEKQSIEIYYDFSSLLRGDTTTRYASYNTALQSGWMTRNEVRAREGLPPMDGGDQPLQPLNMGNPGGNPAKAPAKPAPDDPKDDEEEDDEEEDDDE